MSGKLSPPLCRAAICGGKETKIKVKTDVQLAKTNSSKLKQSINLLQSLHTRVTLSLTSAWPHFAVQLELQNAKTGPHLYSTERTVGYDFEKENPDSLVPRKKHCTKNIVLNFNLA